MELYKISDIREDLTPFAHNRDENILNIRNVLLQFFRQMENNKLMSKILKSIYKEIGIKVKDKEVLNYFERLMDNPTENKDILFELAQAFINYSDDEEFCENKIYILIKNFYGEDMVKEYDSFEEAEADIDDWYTGCCDDTYIAENILFPILCSVQTREYDYTVNFCTVFEMNADGIEEGRESWEEAWENGEI